MNCSSAGEKNLEIQKILENELRLKHVDDIP